MGNVILQARQSIRYILCALAILCYALLAQYELTRYLHKYEFAYLLGVVLAALTLFWLVRVVSVSRLIMVVLFSPVVCTVMGYIFITFAFYNGHGHFGKTGILDWMFAATVMSYLGAKSWLLSVLLLPAYWYSWAYGGTRAATAT